MKIESQRAKAIDAYLSYHPKAHLGQRPLEIGGKKQYLPLYCFLIELLCYNANNGRLAMERRKWERENKRVLDTRVAEDAAIIRDMLLELDSGKTAVLKEDLRQVGQMEPGVITHDGIVINGNRRMAVLEELHKDEPTGKWKYLEAIRLPPEISEQDLWKIEADLQLSKDKVAEYHPVNELLKIKEGRDRGLSPEEIAAAMYAWKASEVEEALDRLTLIDNFLHFWNQQGNYGLIKEFGLHEYFIDIQRRVIAPAKLAGVPKRERHKRLQYTFALIRASCLMPSKGKGGRKGITHWDIRKLDKIFSDIHASAAFVEPLSEGAKKLHKVPPEVVIEGFRDAEEVLRMREDRGKPVKLIEKAIKALESIDRESEYLCNERVGHALTRLSELVQAIQQQLADQQAIH
jgi:hypothetical protein